MKDRELVLSKEEISALDRRAIDGGIPSLTLMRNAAAAVYRRIQTLGVDLAAPVVVCGGGNNGGDGYALAILMEDSGVPVAVLESAKPKSRDCIYYASRCDSPRVDESALDSATLIVDAMYGFSFRGSLSPHDAALTRRINASRAFVLAIDLPSGTEADGDYCDDCVTADATCTFTAEKPATASYSALSHCGQVFVEDIGIPASAGVPEESPVRLIRSVDGMIRDREENSHKGTFGTLAILAGSADMPGAAYLCATGALHAGVGLVKLASDASALGVLKNRLSEPVFLSGGAEAAAQTSKTALLVGCGLGRGFDASLGALLRGSDVPTVIDADGINFLASHIDVLKEMQAPAALTPHPMELSRLTGCGVEEINRNRVRTARAFAAEHGCFLLLKGSRTVIAAPDGRVRITVSGCSALAKGGSGDVLAGVVGALAAQGYDLFDALTVGAFLHGRAGERRAARFGAHGALPSQLPEEIGRLLG